LSDRVDSRSLSYLPDPFDTGSKIRSRYKLGTSWTCYSVSSLEPGGHVDLMVTTAIYSLKMALANQQPVREFISLSTSLQFGETNVIIPLYVYFVKFYNEC
jgi:hypothetical protein